MSKSKFPTFRRFVAPILKVFKGFKKLVSDNTMTPDILMKKTGKRCSECGDEIVRQQGRCPDCGDKLQWNPGNPFGGHNPYGPGGILGSVDPVIPKGCLNPGCDSDSCWECTDTVVWEGCPRCRDANLKKAFRASLEGLPGCLGIAWVVSAVVCALLYLLVW